jgi:phospho-N-acetylmuramoyl-pentapeptide-transferase
MNIYDARAMLGLYCYRAGYYPAALLQWTHIPEKNRKLRPTIQHLLEELEARLALETQETQPLRRDSIVQQQPILTGNLAPADLPNPHEPITAETPLDERVDNGYSSIPPSSHSTPLTSQLPGGRDQLRPYNDTNRGGNEEKQLMQPAIRNGWLARLRHNSSEGNNGRDNAAKK